MRFLVRRVSRKRPCGSPLSSRGLSPLAPEQRPLTKHERRQMLRVAVALLGLVAAVCCLLAVLP